jgi:exo-beta-1,3-glucanase (GH17 family)
MKISLVLIVFVVTLITVVYGTSKTTAAKMSTMVSAFTPNSTRPGCIMFTEYVGSYHSGQKLPNSLINTLMSILKNSTSYRCIEIMGLEPGIISLAQSHGFKVHGIVWLTLSSSDNSAAINSAISATKSYPSTVISISCGSELAFRSGTGTTVTNIVKNCIDKIRNAGITVPVGTQDSLKTFNHGWSAITSSVDFFGVNIYPWYDNNAGTCLPYTKAAAQTYKRYLSVKAKYPGKTFVSTDFLT